MGCSGRKDPVTIASPAALNQQRDRAPATPPPPQAVRQPGGCGERGAPEPDRPVIDGDAEDRLEISMPCPKSHGLGWRTVTASVSRPVRVGLQLQPQHAAYKKIRSTAAEAEELGADIVFNWDHFYPLYGDPDGQQFECWTMLGAWAESTSRVEIGALVTCNSYRNPELLADMARTVDHISDGRLILGIGSGWFEKDYAEYGYEFGTAGGRLNDLAEALPRIESRLSKLNPPPTRKIPVLIGGGGEKKTLRLVAEHADIWHSFGDPEAVERKVSILRQHSADAGRDPAEIEISVGVNGSPDELGPTLRSLGVSLFTVGVGGPDYDLSRLRDWIAWRNAQNS